MAPTLVLNGPLNRRAARDVRPLLEQATAEGVPDVLVDLSDVPAIDGTGLGVLVAASLRAAARGGRLQLSGAAPGVAVLLEAASLQRSESRETAPAR